jgi:hypothetical protein
MTSEEMRMTRAAQEIGNMARALHWMLSNVEVQHSEELPSDAQAAFNEAIIGLLKLDRALMKLRLQEINGAT